MSLTTTSGGVCVRGPKTRITPVTGGAAWQPESTSRATVARSRAAPPTSADVHLDRDLAELAHWALPVVERGVDVHDVGHRPVTGVAQDDQGPVRMQPCQHLQRL